MAAERSKGHYNLRFSNDDPEQYVSRTTLYRRKKCFRHLERQEEVEEMALSDLPFSNKPEEMDDISVKDCTSQEIDSYSDTNCSTEEGDSQVHSLTSDSQSDIEDLAEEHFESVPENPEDNGTEMFVCFYK